MKKKMLSLILAGIMFGGAALPVYAGEEQKKQSVYQRVEKKIDQAKKYINDKAEKHEEVLGYIVGTVLVAAFVGCFYAKCVQINREHNKWEKKRLANIQNGYKVHEKQSQAVYNKDGILKKIIQTFSVSSIDPKTGKEVCKNYTFDLQPMREATS